MRYGRPIRLDTSAYSNPENSFHLVVRTHPEVGTMPRPVRDVIWNSLIDQQSRPEITLHVCVLMPDHVHMIANPGTIDLVRWMAHWKSISTRAAWSAGHEGTVWQRRFYDRGLRGEEEFEVAAQYVLRNPSDAGLVTVDDGWPHRWARWLK